MTPSSWRKIDEWKQPLFANSEICEILEPRDGGRRLYRLVTFGFFFLGGGVYIYKFVNIALWTACHVSKTPESGRWLF